MRTELPSLVGRDHLAYRGYYVSPPRPINLECHVTDLYLGVPSHPGPRKYQFPVKNCVDGDLCESFALLPMTKQQQVAAELDRSVSDVLKKIEAVRVSSGY